MIDLNELHNEQKQISDLIIQTIKGDTLSCIPYFTYHGPCLERDEYMKGRHGIYIFTVSETIYVTSEMAKRYNNATNWDDSLVGASFNYPRPDILNVGDVFYLGKVSGKSDSIYQRLRVHYGPRTDSATNGIKMQMPERAFINGKLVVHTFFLDKKYKELRYIIIDPVEKILHNKLKPITGGKQ